MKSIYKVMIRKQKKTLRALSIEDMPLWITYGDTKDKFSAEKNSTVYYTWKDQWLSNKNTMEIQKTFPAIFREERGTLGNKNQTAPFH